MNTKNIVFCLALVAIPQVVNAVGGEVFKINITKSLGYCEDMKPEVIPPMKGDPSWVRIDSSTQLTLSKSLSFDPALTETLQIVRSYQSGKKSVTFVAVGLPESPNQRSIFEKQRGM